MNKPVDYILFDVNFWFRYNFLAKIYSFGVVLTPSNGV
jgi:hypothetical protein